MVTLSTVNPNRLGVVHRDGESGEVGNAITNRFAGREKKVRSKGLNLKEGNSLSRIKAADHWLARIAEGGLSSGMVFLAELEGDRVSWLGNNSGGVE